MTEEKYDIERQKAEIRDCLARARKTVEESNALVEQAGLRIQETDRLLASRGLTREQVLNMQFTDEQRELVNAELRRRGLQPLDFSEPEGFDDLTARMRDGSVALDGGYAEAPADDAVAARASKFRMMMQEYRVQ